MESNVFKKLNSGKKLIRKCHVCGEVNESFEEMRKCKKCKKSFLPLNYNLSDPTNEGQFEDSFLHCDELSSEDLIKGIHVIW